MIVIKSAEMMRMNKKARGVTNDQTMCKIKRERKSDCDDDEDDEHEAVAIPLQNK